VSDPHILDARKSGSRTGGPSFSLQHRLERALWGVAWGLLAAWTPPPLHGWRRALLRLFGARIAPTARIYGTAKIWYPRYLSVADHAVIGPGATCYSMAPIAIGAGATVSQRAHLCAGTHDIDDAHFQLVAEPISVGAKAWIAAEAFVGPGVTVGEGAVLGARGVTAKDLPAWSVSVGNPARVIRSRNRH
jgi:putative colanic acid biosynthesis acetyltransferase WcaF